MLKQWFSTLNDSFNRQFFTNTNAQKPVTEILTWLAWSLSISPFFFAPKLPGKFQCAIRTDNHWLKKWRSPLLNKVWPGQYGRHSLVSGRSGVWAHLSVGGMRQCDLVKWSWMSEACIFHRFYYTHWLLETKSVRKSKWRGGGKHHSELKDCAFREN